MTIDKYIQYVLIGLNLIGAIIYILLLCKKRRKVTTAEEKTDIDQEIANVALNAINYIKTYCRQNGYIFNEKAVKKEFKKEIKKTKGVTNEKENS